MNNSLTTEPKIFSITTSAPVNTEKHDSKKSICLRCFNRIMSPMINISRKAYTKIAKSVTSGKHYQQSLHKTISTKWEKIKTLTNLHLSSAKKSIISMASYVKKSQDSAFRKMGNLASMPKLSTRNLSKISPFSKLKNIGMKGIEYITIAKNKLSNNKES